MSSRIHRHVGFALITAGLFASWGLGCSVAADPDEEAISEDGEQEAVSEEVGEDEAAASSCSECRYRYCDISSSGSCAKYYYWYHNNCPGIPTGWGGKCKTVFYSCGGACP